MRKKGGTKPALLSSRLDRSRTHTRQVSSRLDRSRTHTRQGPAAAQTETPANFPAGVSAYGVIVGNAPGRSFENEPDER